MSIETDLAYVKQVLDRTRKSVLIDTLPLVVWGLLTVVGCALSTWSERLNNVWLWVVLMAAGWIYAAWRTWQTLRAREVVTLVETGVYALWFSVYLAMSMVGFAGYAIGVVPADAIAFHDAVLFGLAFVVSAGLMRSWPMGMVGVGWWIGSFIIALAPEAHRLLIFGAAIIALLIVPSLVYRHRHDHE